MKKFILISLMLILSPTVWLRGSPVVTNSDVLVTAGSEAIVVVSNNLACTPEVEWFVGSYYVLNSTDYIITSNDNMLLTNTPNNEWADVDASKIRYSRDKSYCFVQLSATSGGADKTIVNSLVKFLPNTRDMTQLPATSGGAVLKKDNNS